MAHREQQGKIKRMKDPGEKEEVAKKNKLFNLQTCTRHKAKFAKNYQKLLN